jgi:hypothetical protein
VIATGLIATGIIAVLAVIPVALQTGHLAQDETRAPQIAQTILGSLAAQAPSSLFNSVLLPLPGPDNTTNTTLSLDLTTSSSPNAPSVYADNDGKLTQDPTAAVYAIFIFTNNSPPGFTDMGYANQVTVRVAWPAKAPAANQTFRDFVRIISKY